ncbi:MAG: Helix-turn-helix type 11 domain-containing protein [uncultured Clostridium sp.]
MVKKSNWTNEDDKKLIELFKLGYTSQQIAKKLNRTKESVQKRIQMLKKKEIICEKDRELKQIEIREIKKAINRENSQHLSNRETIRACMSVYKNNDKGDLVLDRKKGKEQGFAFPLDMPYSNVNEEIRKFEKFAENNRELNVVEYVKLEVERLENFKKEVRKDIERISI